MRSVSISLVDTREIVGCIGIVGRSECAQLRCFLVHPHYRSIGLGKKLLQEALDFVKAPNYRSVYLNTTNDLEKAIDMYEKAGFTKKSEKINNSWRENLMELELERNI